MPVYNARRIVQEGILSVTLSLVLNMASGSVLSRGIELLVAVPVVLALAPPLGGMAGAVGSMLSARLSTALHLGLVKPRIEKNDVLAENLVAAATIALVSSLYLSLAMYLLSEFAGIGTLGLFDLTKITLLASMSVSTITITISVLISFLSFQRNLDPSSTTIPVVTSIGDLTAASSLILAAVILGIV